VRHQFSAIYMEATRVCNLRCPMCMTGSNDAPLVRERRARELSFEEIRDLVLLPGMRLGIKAVAWSGGEFLLRKDVYDLLRLTVDLGLKANVCTNCETVDRAQLEAIKEATKGNVSIAVGLNSAGEDNDWSRDAGAERVIEVLEICKELDLDRHVIITIGKHNTETFEKTVEYLVENRISYNRSPLVARGSGCDYFSEQGFTREELRDDFHPTLRKYVNGYVSYTPFFLSPELHERVSGGERNNTVPQNPPIGCWCGNWLAVNPEGDVSVCPVLLDTLSAGNVREKPLDELVATSPLFEAITDRSLLKGKCGRCRYQYTCGGCRAMAYYHTGDILEEDPTCFFEPEDPTTVSEFEEETNKAFKKYLIVARHAGFYERPKKS